MSKYIVCIYGKFDNRDQVLENTLASNEYVIGKDVVIPRVLNDARPGDILLLSINQKIVAYGKVRKKLSKYPRPDENWKYHLVVEKWIIFDSFDNKNGISTDGINKHCINESFSNNIAKEVDPNWLEEKLKKFQTRKISFLNSIARFGKGFYKFKGTATRTEVWYATLFAFIGCLLIGIASFAWSLNIEETASKITERYEKEINSKIEELVERVNAGLHELKQSPQDNDIKIRYSELLISELLNIHPALGKRDRWTGFDETGFRYSRHLDDEAEESIEALAYRTVRDTYKEIYENIRSKWEKEYDAAFECSDLVVVSLEVIAFFSTLLVLPPFLALCVRRWRGRALFPSSKLLLLLPLSIVAGFWCAGFWQFSFFCNTLLPASYHFGSMVLAAVQSGIMISVFSTAIFGLIMNKNKSSLPLHSQQNCEVKTSSNIAQYGLPYSTGFVESLSRFWGNYFNFSGRATRTEFWFAILFNVLVSISIIYLSFILLSVSTNRYDEPSEIALTLTYALSGGWGAITFCPFLSLYTRRLHDTNRSGWMLWWTLLIIPTFYLICVIAFCDSSRGRNKFGDSKKYPE